jgi:hypothetical protein
MVWLRRRHLHNRGTLRCDPRPQYQDELELWSRHWGHNVSHHSGWLALLQRPAPSTTICKEGANVFSNDASGNMQTLQSLPRSASHQEAQRHQVVEDVEVVDLGHFKVWLRHMQCHLPKRCMCGLWANGGSVLQSRLGMVGVSVCKCTLLQHPAHMSAIVAHSLKCVVMNSVHVHANLGQTCACSRVVVLMVLAMLLNLNGKACV